MKQKLNTIEENTTAIVEEKRSKFIADIFCVETQEEANKRIQEIKKKYHDARHHCYAYIVYEDGIKQKKFSDDGEPGGTAGSPILNVIEKNDLCNVLIVVTRYFGGILLGAGGLVRAYTEAAVNAIKSANIIEKIEGISAEVLISYQDLEKFKYYCKTNEINITEIKYLENIVCKIEFPNEKKDEIESLQQEGEKIKLIDYRIIERKMINKKK